eukprot:5581271-Alexandrium_andersonii.AAC.1
MAAPPALHGGCASEPLRACSPVQDDGGKRLQEMGAAVMPRGRGASARAGRGSDGKGRNCWRGRRGAGRRVLRAL